MVEDEKPLSLTEYLRDVVEWRWSDFLRVEGDESAYTSDQGAVLALVRAIARRQLPAIKEAVDRLDGRQAAVTEVVFPSFKMLYPRAKTKELMGKAAEETKAIEAPTTDGPEPEIMATGSIREAIVKMGKQPRSLVVVILAAADEHQQLYEQGLGTESQYGDPKVKSVIAAILHDMARRGDLKAIFEVLDQIDGKIANKIEIKGEDVEMISYEEVAPPNAELNNDGIYEVTMPQLTNMWVGALGGEVDDQRRFGDGR